MQSIRLSFLLLAGLLAACGTEPAKFPYPPQFVEPSKVSVHMLEAPPQPGSRAHKQAIEDILVMQRDLTPAEIADIKQEVKILPQMLVEPVLGDAFTPEAFPQLYTLLRHAGSDAWRINDMLQDHWGEVRPWLADKRIARYVEPITRPGYPSGHTVTNHVWAHILADLMPCEEDALFERAYAVGHNRVLGGAHFPHDVAAGKKLAKIIYHRMLENDAFQEERMAAWEEIQRNVKFGIPAKEGTLIDTGYMARCAPVAIPPAPTAPTAIPAM